MTKWYEAAYIDRRIWVLDHLNQYKLNAEEALVGLQLVHFNECGRPISLETLSKHCGLSSDKVD